ncbi:MAG: hypothetical protein WC351_05595, partial [Candidatus Izemoplasmatales bacterium]
MKKMMMCGLAVLILIVFVGCNADTTDLSTTHPTTQTTSPTTTQIPPTTYDSSLTGGTQTSPSTQLPPVTTTQLPPVTTTQLPSLTTTRSTTTTQPTFPVWNTESIHYEAAHIRMFGSGTPAGTVHYDSLNDLAVIWNIDASLDNYGGVQTPMLALDFSQAVIFQMEVVDVYMQYIVKLAVQGESEYYYVLSDEPTTGLVSINVVDAMLSDKYRIRNTQPDPGYQSGWKYAGQT